MGKRDEFGLLAGSNVSKAAALAARPSGTTMGEIIDVTGDTQYNVFRRLQKNGYDVRQEGSGRSMRIWLYHPDANNNLVDNTDEVPGSDISENEIFDEQHPGEPDYSDIERVTFSLERDLQRALRTSLDKLEGGLSAVDGGREEAFRDVTAKDEAGNIVVIELKAGKAGPNAVAQLLAYMGEVNSAQHSAGAVRGILVAADFQEKALAAASVVPNLILKQYRFHLTFEDA